LTDQVVITHGSQVTVEWLNRVLTRAGAIETGAVSSFEIASGDANWSSNARLRIKYRPRSTGSKPQLLFLKMCEAGRSGFFLESEVDYYTRDYAGCEDAPLVPCYDACYSRELGAYHILLEDLTETHQTTWHEKPTHEHALTMARALATLHAYRWGEARWAGTSAVMPSTPVLSHYIGHIEKGLEPMLNEVRSDVPPVWETRLRAIFRTHPRLMVERTRNPEGFTLVHGDVNRGNVLAPYAPEGKTYIVDRQPFDWSLTTWLAASDLAYMMIPWWEEGERRELEMPVLSEYHAELTRRGVTQYGWDELLGDYRLCVFETIYTAVEWCGTEDDLRNKKWVWYPKLQRGMAAFEDWRCADLIG
jgi:hypothetical protein